MRTDAGFTLVQEFYVVLVLHNSTLISFRFILYCLCFSGEWQKVTQKAVRWPCGVCGTGIGNNSIQCTNCQKWVHRKSSGRKGSMYKVMRTCVCRGCRNPVTSAGCTSVDIGVNANLELVDKFCYIGDMLSVDGYADAAVETRICIG